MCNSRLSSEIHLPKGTHSGDVYIHYVGIVRVANLMLDIDMIPCLLLLLCSVYSHECVYQYVTVFPNIY